jgi:hypothetical protein
VIISFYLGKVKSAFECDCVKRGQANNTVDNEMGSALDLG